MAGVILVNPPYMDFIYSKRKAGAAVEMPLGLAYIAAAVETAGMAVAVIDANAEGLSVQETAERVASTPGQIVGVTSTTTAMPLAYQLCDEIKNLCQKTIVIGGPHVSFMDRQTLQESPSIDMVASGEGELTMVELAQQDGDPQGVKGLTYRKHGSDEVVVNDSRPLMADIDSVPFPARHLFPIERYRPGAVLNAGAKGKKYASMITARGCPNRCTFCSSAHFWGTKVRFRYPVNVVDEIEHLVKTYGTRQIFFKDDTFTASPTSVVSRK